MNDDELRSLIRAAIQKHMGGSSPEQVRLKPATTGVVENTTGVLELPVSISFGQYQLERSAGDTSCLIEPAVQCNHCGFCKCHGH
jgi:hypothetical protein